MTKKVIKLKESQLRKVIKESITRVLEGRKSSDDHDIECDIVKEDTWHRGLKRGYSYEGLLKQLEGINKDRQGIYYEISLIRQTVGDTPEARAEISKLIGEKDKLTRQAEAIRQRIKEIKNEHGKHVFTAKELRDKERWVDRNIEKPERPKMSQELLKKRANSQSEYGRFSRDQYIQKMYNEIVKNQYLLIPNGRKGIKLSDGRQVFKPWNRAGMVEHFKKFIEREHPDKVVKISLVPKQRVRGQLDDEVFYDLKLSLADKQV